MPLKTDDTMIVNRFNRFDGIVSWIKSCRAEIRCQILDALAMNRINLASLTKQALHNAIFLRANGVRSTKWQALPVVVNVLIKSAAKSNIYQLQTRQMAITGLFWRRASFKSANSNSSRTIL